MTTAQRTQRPMTPNEYRYWWERASDEEIIEAQHPDEYEAEYRARQAQRQTEPRRQASQRSHAPARNQPQEEKKSQKAVKVFHWDRTVPVAFGLALLGLWWLAGARWTIDGSPLLLNVVLDFLRFPANWRVGMVTTFAPYFWLFWLPIGISAIEHRNAPWRLERKSGILVVIFLSLIWFVVTGADWSSTYLALTNPPVDAWLITKQIAALPILAAALTTLTTFAPEVGIAVLLWWLWEPTK